MRLSVPFFHHTLGKPSIAHGIFRPMAQMFGWCSCCGYVGGCMFKALSPAEVILSFTGAGLPGGVALRRCSTAASRGEVIADRTLLTASPATPAPAKIAAAALAGNSNRPYQCMP